MASNGRRVDPDALAATTAGLPLPSITEEVDVIDLFRTYQESCRMRVAACGDDPGLRLGALEPLVNELLEQNEMLIQSISQLQQDRNRDQMCHKSPSNGQAGEQKSLQQVTADSMSQSSDAGHVSATQVIRELSSHLTALQIENNFLCDKNDNLEHDIENLLDMIEFERSTRRPTHDMTDSKIDDQRMIESGPGARNSDPNGKLLTFCDSLAPEDVYGPIESHSESVSCSLQRIDDSVGNEERRGENEITDRPDDNSENRTNATATTVTSHSLKSLDAGSTGKDSGVSSGAECATAIKSDDICCCSGSSVQAKQVTSSDSSCSLVSTNQQLLLEEKDLLIADLQQHLESLTRQVHLSDHVIKKIEEKLSDKRKECSEWRAKAFDWQRKLNEHIKENFDLKERILTLNDHKRCLMTRLDDESESREQAFEELAVLRRRSSQLLQQNEFQSMTIEHLKEAIITKTRALSSISSSTPSLTTRLYRNSTMQL